MNLLPFDPVLAFALACIVGAFAYGLIGFQKKSRAVVADLVGFIQAVNSSPGVRGDDALDATLRSGSELSVVWRRVKAARFATGDGRLVLAHEPADLVTADDLLDTVSGFRLWSATPNYLVGLGLLFTFIGLVLALASVDATNLNDPTQLTRLFAAMKLKFIASAAGIATSIVFSLYLRRRVGVIHRLCAELQAALATRYPVVDPVVNAILGVGASVTRLETALEDSRRIAGRTADASERSLDIWGNVVEQLHTAATQLKQFNDELSISIGNVLEERFEQKLLPPLHDALKSLEHAVNGVRDAQTSTDGEMVRGVVSEFRNAISGGTASEVASVAATLKQLNESLTATKSDLQSIGRTIEANVVSGLRGATGQLTESIGTLARELSATLTASSGTAAQRLDAATAQAEGRFGAAVERLDVLLQQARGAVDAGSSSVQTTERMLARFSDIVSSLEQAQAGFARIAEPIRGSSEQLSAAADRVRVAADAILTATESSRAVQDRISETWLQAGQRFENIDRDLAKVFTDLNQGLTSYAATVNEFNGKLTNEFTRALGSLQGIVGELDETLQEMRAQVSQVGR